MALKKIKTTQLTTNNLFIHARETAASCKHLTAAHVLRIFRPPQCSSCRRTLFAWTVALRSLPVRRGATSHDSSLVTIQTERDQKKSVPDFQSSFGAMRWRMSASVPEDQAWGWKWSEVKHSRADSAHSCLSTRRWVKTLLLRRRGQSWRMERDEVSFWRSVFSLFFRRASHVQAAGLHFWGRVFSSWLQGSRLVRSAEMVDSKPLLQDRPPAYTTVPGGYEYGPQQQQQQQPPPPHGYGSIPPPAPPPYAYPDGQGKSSRLCRSPAGGRRHPCSVPLPNLRWLWFNLINEEMTNFKRQIFRENISFLFTPARAV